MRLFYGTLRLWVVENMLQPVTLVPGSTMVQTGTEQYRESTLTYNSDTTPLHLL